MGGKHNEANVRLKFSLEKNIKAEMWFLEFNQWPQSNINQI